MKSYLLRIKIPIYTAAFASFIFSVSLWFTQNRTEAIFVGVWVPSILSFGSLYLYGKKER